MSQCGEGGSFQPRDVVDLLSAGHEIACHTYSHLRASNCSLARFKADLDMNSKAFRDLSGKSMNNFAFPYGVVTPEAMTLVSERFDTTRGNQSGPNSMRQPSRYLKTFKLYETRNDWKNIMIVMNNAKEFHEWIIFYTHDVQANPSRFGCTPQLLEKTVDLAIKLDLKILSVQEAWALQHFVNPHA